MSRKFILVRRAAYVVFAGILTSIAGFYYFGGGFVKQGPQIVEFDYDRDKDFIHKVSQKNWYWLFLGDKYPLEFMMKERAPNYDPRYLGKLNIKVLREDGEDRAFVAYFKKKFNVGQLLFLAVDEKYRGKGYAKRLLDYVCSDFKKQGCSKIWFPTRITNYRAEGLYKGLGFHEVDRNDIHIFFEKEL